MAPRVGRAGLPTGVPSKAVDVDCTEYVKLIDDDPGVRAEDQLNEIGDFSHSWHIGNHVFAMDLFETLRGDLDRAAIPTRERGLSGQLRLNRP